MDTKKVEEVLSRLDVGLAAELKRVCISLGFTTEDVKKLCRKGALTPLLWQGRGFGKVKIEVDIDRTKDPLELLDQQFKHLVLDTYHEGSDALDRIDLAQIRLEHMICDGESEISMETRIERLWEVGLVPLDAYAYRIFWEGRERLPLSLRQKKKRSNYGSYPIIAFPGSILKSQKSDFRGCLAMQWNGTWEQVIVNCSCCLRNQYLIMAVPG